MMLAEQAFDPKYLEYWLKTATHGLCEEACASIRTEIEPRYLLLYWDQLAAGLPEDQAAYQAFRALGDPEAALRRFARTYLLEYEATMVARLSDHPTRRARIGELVDLLLPLVLLWCAWLQRDTPGKRTLLACWAFLILLKLLVSMRIFCARHLKFATRVLLDCLNTIYFCGFLSMVLTYDSVRGVVPPQMPVVFLMPIVVFTILFYQGRIWLKLSRRASV